MADELHGDAVRLVKILLEGKQHQHQIHRTANPPDPPGPPGPNLRAHIVHGAHPGGAQTFFQGEIELGRIDPDEEIRRAGEEMFRKPRTRRR